MIKHKLRLGSLLLLLSLSVWAADEPAMYPALQPVAGEKGAQIKRGEYLAKASDCVACHTAIGGKPFAGGLPLNTPFGKFYAPNITPDKKYGIGAWTLADFRRVMKKAVRRDGSHSFPVFPYLYYSRMTDQDIEDLYAYMQAIPAVPKPNHKHDVPFPFNVRLGQIGWKLLFFHPQRDAIKPDPSKSVRWNRGQYLVEGPGHCAMCHTPINLLGAPKRDLAYTGNTVDGYYAPNITGDNLQGVSLDQIVRIFKQNKLPGGNTSVHGPMAQVNRDSLRYLTDEDLYSIATYIKSLKSAVAIAKPGEAPPDKIYGSFCSGCHTAGSGGAPRLGDGGEWAERLADGKGMVYARAIHGYNSMPAKGNCVVCSEEDIKAVVDWMLTQTDQGGGSFKPRRKGAGAVKKLTLQDGERVYQRSCASCHAAGAAGDAPKVGDRTVWAPRIAKGMDVLFANTIKGPDGQHHGCKTCSHAELIAAVKYMAQHSAAPGKDYRLW